MHSQQEILPIHQNVFIVLLFTITSYKHSLPTCLHSKLFMSVQWIEHQGQMTNNMSHIKI